MRLQALAAAARPISGIVAHAVCVKWWVILAAAAPFAAFPAPGLPAPHLISIMPMGAKSGSTIEVSIHGNDLDQAGALLFSSPAVAATPLEPARGNPGTVRFKVTVAHDAPRGLYEARVLTPLGLSNPRMFAVGNLAEFTQEIPNNKQEDAVPLAPNSVVNARATAAALDWYRLEARQGQRLMIHCATEEIDSRLRPVLAVTDSAGRDLVIERRSGVIDFTPPATGACYLKVHGLTFEGGAECFYRLALTEGGIVEEAFPPVAGQPGTRLHGPGLPHGGTALDAISIPGARTPGWAFTIAGQKAAPLAAAALDAFAWTPSQLALMPRPLLILNHAGIIGIENEPAQHSGAVTRISLPADIAGRFDSSADVHQFEFAARKGQTWWVEVTSHRLGCTTDPHIVIQQIAAKGERRDVAEFADIASPVTGTPYDLASLDAAGRFDVKEDGTYRLRLHDAAGGTRRTTGTGYRLRVRHADPGFALIAWPYVPPFAGNDRSAPLTTPTVRRGETKAWHLAAIRRDGFDGAIHLEAASAPPGLSVSTAEIPAKASQGFVFFTAADDAPAVNAPWTLTGRAQIGGKAVDQPVRMASLVWPLLDGNVEPPRTRLHAQPWFAIAEQGMPPVRITPADAASATAKAGETVTVTFNVDWHDEVTAPIKLKGVGPSWAALKEIDLPVKAAQVEVRLDLAALKTPPGEHLLALHGTATGKHQPAKGSGDAKTPPRTFTEFIVSQPLRLIVTAAPSP